MHRPSTRFLSALSALGAHVSCASPAQSNLEVHLLDRAGFEASVEPVLEARCASTMCHARPERALSLYAPLRWRLDPSRTSIDEPLSEPETTHNYAASCALAGVGDPSEQPALTRKPLGEPAGVYHGGGVVFSDTTDPDFVAIQSWIHGPSEGGSP